MTANLSTGALSPTSKGGLRRVLGLGSLVSVAVGLVVSQGVMVLMLQGAGTVSYTHLRAHET